MKIGTNYREGGGGCKNRGCLDNFANQLQFAPCATFTKSLSSSLFADIKQRDKSAFFLWMHAESVRNSSPCGHVTDEIGIRSDLFLNYASSDPGLAASGSNRTGLMSEVVLCSKLRLSSSRPEQKKKWVCLQENADEDDFIFMWVAENILHPRCLWWCFS